MPLAGVEHDEPPVAEQQRHGLDVERAEVDAQRGVGRAVERGELVEQAGVGSDPVVLDARAQPRDVGAVQRTDAAVMPAVALLAALVCAVARCARARAELDQGEAQRDLERGGGGEAGAGRQLAGEVDAGADEREAFAGELGDGPVHERAPAVGGLGRRGRELVALVEIARVRVHAVRVGRIARKGVGADGDAFGDRERQRETFVVVGVLADQVDAPGRERAGALRRHVRSPRAAWRRTPRAACPR